jgi:NAD(P)-dependent dehydrogenase (short-subunit alcohol dehydrogenase family)
MESKRKTMIVTGAGKGIGAGVTSAFLELGYNVVANSLTIKASTFEASERLAVVPGDIGDLIYSRGNRFDRDKDFRLD